MLIGVPLLDLWLVIHTVADAFGLQEQNRTRNARNDTKREAEVQAELAAKARERDMRFRLERRERDVRPATAAETTHVQVGGPPEPQVPNTAAVTEMERLPEDIGMRALAAALIPFVGATFLLVFRPAVFSEFLSLGNVAALACSLAIGFTIPFSSRLDHDLALPLSAFLFSAVFSVLTCSYAAVRDSRETRWMSSSIAPQNKCSDGFWRFLRSPFLDVQAKTNALPIEGRKMNITENLNIVGASMLLVAGLAACEKQNPGPAETAGKNNITERIIFEMRNCV